MPRTLLNEMDRTDVLDRLARVRPDSVQQWGTLDAPRMLCHLADSMRVALGDLPSVPVHNLFTRTIGKLLVVNSSLKPPPGKVKTAPEMLTTNPAGWSADLRTCEALIARVGAGEAASVHPTFGPLTPAEWGRLCWKHWDHHLRQFGL